MKKNLKKLLAFFCALVLLVTACFTEGAMKQAEAETETTSTETTDEVKPVELYGFQNVTLNSLTDANGSVMVDKEYASGEYTYKLANDVNFDKKLFTAWVKFTNPDTVSWWSNRICIGGTNGACWGLSVALDENESLLVCDAAGTQIAEPQIKEPISPSKVKIDSFLGTEILLQVGFEYLDCDGDGNQNDVRILVYVNGNVGLNKIVKNCNMNTLGEYVRVSISTECKMNINKVDLPIKPVELDGFTNVTPSDVVYEGTTTPMDEKTYQGGSSSSQGFQLKEGDNFDKKLFTAYVKYNPAYWWTTRICVGGSWTARGLAICVSTDGKTLYIHDWANDGYEFSTSFEEKTITATAAGVTSFKDEFLLQMGYEYLDNNIVRVLLYVNGNNVWDESISNCDTTNFLGNYVGTYTESVSDSVSIRAYQSEVEPVTLASHDTVTISDFQDSAGKEMEAKGYDYDSVNPTSLFSLKDGSTSFNEKLLSMKVKFGHRDGASSSYENRLAIPAADGSNGIFVYINAEGQLCIDDTIATVHYERIDCATAGVTSFKDNPFILQMSFKDTTNGLELGVYINGKLCATYYWTEAKTSDYSSKLDLTRSLKDAFIVVSDVDAKEFPADPAIMPDSSFERITFDSFGIKDGTYSEITEKSISADSLHQKVLCGKVKFELSQWFTFRLGGTSEWCGLYLNQDGTNNIAVKWALADGNSATITDIDDNALTSFTSDDAEVTLLGGEYNLMISMESTDVNGDGTNDVKFGVWFADKLYNDQYYYVWNQGDSLGNKFGINSDGTTKITLNSVEEYLPQPDASYERITFQHFMVEDGEYESEGPAWIIHNNFKKKDNLDKVVVCGDIQLNGGTDAYLLALGEKNSNPYDGIFMWISGSTMTLSIPSSTTEQAFITSTDVGVGETFVGNQFSLMWTVEFVNSDTDGQLDDVKVQLWFNGYLCVEKIFVDGGTAADLGNTFSVCCSGEGDSITLNSSSKILNLPGEEFGKLSLSDFEHSGTSATMESGTYVAGDNPSWLILGKAKDCETLDKKVVSFDILQSGTTGTQYQMRIGGAGGEWYGLALNTSSTGTIDIGWCKSDGSWADVKDGSQWMYVDVNDTTYSNRPNISGVVNETFNLMVSMEVVDANNNGVDDVKVRIWFNKIPFVYNGMDSFIYLDCGDSIGNNFTAGYITKNAGEKAFVSLRNVAEYQSNPYYYEDISQYRQSTGYTYPEVEGKTFAGWYTDEDYNTTLKSNVTSGSAYAKFTDDEVLRVKSQIKLDSSNQRPTDKTTLRFVTTVDSLNYYRVGFKYKVEGENIEKDSYNSYPTTEDGKKLANKVYTQLQYIDITDDAELMAYEPDAFSWQSKYFKAWNLADVNASQYGQDVTISAYWITKDGTLVRGQERKICVNDSPTEDTSSKATIDFLGKNTMPIAGYGIWNNQDASSTNGMDTTIFPDYDEAPYFQMFADAGVNLVNYGSDDYAYNPSDVLKQLENGEKYGLGVFVNDSSLLSMTDATDIQNRLALYESKYKSFSGIFLVDEPVETDGWGDDGTAEGRELLSYYTNNTAVTYLNNKNYFTYMNLFPVGLYTSEWEKFFPWLSSKNEEDAKSDYASYITAANAVNSSIISWDHYPFEEGRIKDGNYNYSLYFWNMDKIRTTSLTANNGAGKPFWAYVQAGSQWKNEITAKEFADYYPSKSQFNWIVNTSLAFGAQGIQYYPLIQPVQHAYDGVNAEYDFEVNGILSAWGGKTQWYYYAQEINKHIAEIDEVLMNAKTEKVVVPSSGNAYTQMKDLSSVAISYGVLSGVTGDALVGYFNYGGKVALYVANNQHWAVGEENSVTTQEVTLTLTNNYNEIIKYENAERTDDVATTNKQLTLTMEAGEGILLVLDGIQE